MIGDNRSIPHIGYGDVVLRVNGRVDVRLYRAWLSPGFKVNLVSTGRLGIAGYDCVFAADRSSRATDASGKVIPTGRGSS